MTPNGRERLTAPIRRSDVKEFAATRVMDPERGTRSADGPRVGSMSSYDLESIPAAQAQALRQKLNPSAPAGQLTFDGDASEETLHLVARAGGEAAGVVTAMRESLPEDGVRRGFRIRGLWVAEEHRRKGLGARLLDGCRAHAKAKDGSELWAYVPPEVAGFFSQQGFTTEGPPELHEELGPRVTMRRFHLDED